ncbi:hypothetical protein RJT34_25165 [Clitoria ternatea]|uniref:Uncharacterized protein n=1 Tax=Clitoria ternatea TaxID=43366 RepID=A0AAN9IGL3_CLITE
MANKNVALLLVVCLIVAAACVEDNVTPNRTQQECIDGCLQKCAEYAGPVMCNWLCRLGCPIHPPDNVGDADTSSRKTGPEQKPQI